MSDRTINCAGCGAYLGIIRDARLMKGIVHLCPACEAKRAAAADIDRFLGGFGGRAA